MPVLKEPANAGKLARYISDLEEYARALKKRNLLLESISRSNRESWQEGFAAGMERMPDVDAMMKEQETLRIRLGLDPVTGL